MRVLYIGDEKHQLNNSLFDLLSSENGEEYNIAFLSDINQSANYLQKHKADIVLIDSIYSLGFSIRNITELHEQHPDLPIIVVSDNPDLDQAVKTIHAGAQDFLVRDKLNSYNLVRAIHFALERKQRVSKLKESENQFRQIAETAREGMWVIKSDDTVAFVNQELADILGYQREEIIGSNSLNYVLQEDRDELRQKIRNRRKGIKETYEFRVLRSDGKPLPVLINSTPSFDDQGNYIGATAMITDISYRIQNEQIIK